MLRQEGQIGDLVQPEMLQLLTGWLAVLGRAEDFQVVGMVTYSSPWATPATQSIGGAVQAVCEHCF